MAEPWRKQYRRYQELYFNIVALYKRRQDLKIFLELFLSLIAISVFAVFALKPTLITIIDLVKTNQEKEERISFMDKKIRELSVAEQFISTQSQTIAIIDNAVPGKAFPELFVRQIEGLAKEESVSILGISISEIPLSGEVGKPRARQDVQKLPDGALDVSFTLNLSGEYPNLSNFLTKISSLRRPIITDVINFSSTEAESGNKLILVISGRTPYLGGKGAGPEEKAK